MFIDAGGKVVGSPDFDKSQAYRDQTTAHPGHLSDTCSTFVAGHQVRSTSFVDTPDVQEAIVDGS